MKKLILTTLITLSAALAAPKAKAEVCSSLAEQCELANAIAAEAHANAKAAEAARDDALYLWEQIQDEFQQCLRNDCDPDILEQILAASKAAMQTYNAANAAYQEAADAAAAATQAAIDACTAYIETCKKNPPPGDDIPPVDGEEEGGGDGDPESGGDGDPVPGGDDN